MHLVKRLLSLFFTFKLKVFLEPTRAIISSISDNSIDLSEDLSDFKNVLEMTYPIVFHLSETKIQLFL